VKRIVGVVRDIRINLRGWRAKRRLHSEAASELVKIVLDLRNRVEELEADLDELRSDSRRVAELRIQVEDFLAERT
jgi:hypothetical protein